MAYWLSDQTMRFVEPVLDPYWRQEEINDRII